MGSRHPLFHLWVALRLQLWSHRWEPIAYFLVSGAISVGLLVHAARARRRSPDRRRG